MLTFILYLSLSLPLPILSSGGSFFCDSKIRCYILFVYKFNMYMYTVKAFVGGWLEGEITKEAAITTGTNHRQDVHAYYGYIYWKGHRQQAAEAAGL